MTRLSDAQPQATLIYGPPRSVRGRAANLLRRLLRREQRQELHFVIGPVLANEDELILTWDERGVIRVDR